ncbi:hypothetical protein ACQ4LE_007209 [Meloidogyne hapla]|uniref:FLYWCH-type domain-containing protein n=1 Tax=Meloidogyne hapla TaxID=6305 RepID=A0A1I8BEN6_MELHA
MFGLTERGRKMLIHQGYKYNKEVVRKETTYWTCKKYRTPEKCTGRAKTIGDEIIETQQHTCTPSQIDVEATQIRSKIIQIATYSTHSPMDIVNQCLAGASEEAKAMLPKLESLATIIRRKRKLQGMNNCQNFEINVHEDINQKIKKENVLLDTGIGDPNRTIVYASNLNIKRLSNCDTWLVDGNFEMNSDVFYKPWIIYGLFKNHLIPFIYCLLPNKNEEIYQMVLLAILDVIGEIRPKFFITNFEKTSENIIRKLFPETQIRGSLFYFNKLIWQSIQNKNMEIRFGQEEEYEKILKKFLVLAFCDVKDVRQRFEHLADQLLLQFGNNRENQDFIEYMENNFIGRNRRNPRFPKEMWNWKEINEFQLNGIINSVKNWNKTLQNLFNKTKFKDGFLDEILKENNELCLKLDDGEEVNIENKQTNLMFLEIIKEYKNCDEFDYFSKCSHFVNFY